MLSLKSQTLRHSDDDSEHPKGLDLSAILHLFLLLLSGFSFI